MLVGVSCFCSVNSAESLNISGWNTIHVIEMRAKFGGLNKLGVLQVSDFW